LLNLFQILNFFVLVIYNFMKKETLNFQECTIEFIG